MLTRRVACILVLIALGSACAGPDPSAIKGAIEAKKQESSAAGIRVPPQPDLQRIGRVGLLLGTNSRGWQEALGTPDVDGAVVLAALPGSPAERSGFARGDVITRIGGSAIRSDERALVALRGRPGLPLKVTVSRGTDTRELEVVPAAKIDIDLQKYVDELLAKSPADPTYLLLRSQSTDVIQDAITYVNRALAIEPDLVDALVRRARLFWAESLRITNDAVIQEDRRRAAEDYRRALEIDPDSTDALRARATGALEISKYDDAERDGLRAIGVDPTLPGAYQIVASARYALGRIRDAAGPAQEAVRLDPYEASSYRLLALVFRALDRREDAQATVQVGLTVATDENQRAALRAVVEN